MTILRVKGFMLVCSSCANALEMATLYPDKQTMFDDAHAHGWWTTSDERHVCPSCKPRFSTVVL